MRRAESSAVNRGPTAQAACAHSFVPASMRIPTATTPHPATPRTSAPQAAAKTHRDRQSRPAAARAIPLPASSARAALPASVAYVRGVGAAHEYCSNLCMSEPLGPFGKFSVALTPINSVCVSFCISRATLSALWLVSCAGRAICCFLERTSGVGSSLPSYPAWPYGSCGGFVHAEESIRARSSGETTVTAVPWLSSNLSISSCALPLPPSSLVRSLPRIDDC